MHKTTTQDSIQWEHHKAHPMDPLAREEAQAEDIALFDKLEIVDTELA